MGSNNNKIITKRRRRRSVRVHYDRSHLRFVASMRHLPRQIAQGAFANQIFGGSSFY
jgi:hypothetical protein